MVKGLKRQKSSFNLKANSSEFQSTYNKINLSQISNIFLGHSLMIKVSKMKKTGNLGIFSKNPKSDWSVIYCTFILKPNFRLCLQGNVFISLNLKRVFYWPTRPRPNKWSLFSHMVSIRPSVLTSQKQKRANVSARKSICALWRIPCMKIMTTYWLGLVGHSEVSRFITTFYLKLLY